MVKIFRFLSSVKCLLIPLFLYTIALKIIKGLFYPLYTLFYCPFFHSK
jgi:hypothetical protein